MRFIYNCLLTLLLPVVLLVFMLLGRKNPAWRKRIPERFGRIPHVLAEGGIWLHAASVGEVQASSALIKALQKKWPQRAIIVTTFTPTGSEQVRRVFGESVYHMYVPLDYSWMIKRFIRRLQPALLVLMERELWPNLLTVTHAQGVPILLANARLSEQSLQGYLKYHRFVRPLVQLFDQVAAHNEVDAQRYIDLGVPAEKVTSIGSIKFDLELPAGVGEAGVQLRQQWGAERVVLALASSHEGEDECLLDLYAQLQQHCPDLLLLLVPRHPERFEQVVNATLKRQLKVARRSRDVADQHTQVYVADSMGEMLPILSAADLVLMGGTLVDIGGHNPIEPAALGKPIVVGPYHYSFSEIVKEFAAAGALQQVSNEPEELLQSLLALLQDAPQRQSMGQQAHRLVADNQGAVDQLVGYCETYIKKS